MSSPSEAFLSDEEWGVPSIPTPDGRLADAAGSDGPQAEEEQEDWLTDSPPRSPSAEVGGGQGIVLRQPASARAVAGPLVEAAGSGGGRRHS
eukprot:506135-Pyramimonas_sp.AAC.1